MSARGKVLAHLGTQPLGEEPGQVHRAAHCGRFPRRHLRGRGLQHLWPQLFGKKPDDELRSADWRSRSASSQTVAEQVSEENLSTGLIYPTHSGIFDASLHVAERIAAYISFTVLDGRGRRTWARWFAPELLARCTKGEATWQMYSTAKSIKM